MCPDCAVLRWALEQAQRFVIAFATAQPRVRLIGTVGDPDRARQDAVAVRELSKAALASSPGAAWLETAREVVEVLETTAECLAALESPPSTHGYAVVQQARALLARPEVQALAGR